MLEQQKDVIDKQRARLAFVDSMLPPCEMTVEQIHADRHILVDLDRTLARYDVWKGADHIGEPIPQAINAVKRLIRSGAKVKIFTARAHAENRIAVIRKWLEEQGLFELEITCVKLPSALEIWDDIAVQFEPNMGVKTVDMLNELSANMAAEQEKRIDELQARLIQAEEENVNLKALLKQVVAE